MSMSKDIKKRMLIKKTINAMNKQINILEEQKEKYIQAGREAKQRGITSQYNLALSGLKACITQQKRICEMKLNFEITCQIRDSAKITAEFLAGMSVLSKDMAKVSKEANFKKVGEQFEKAMIANETIAEQIDVFLEDTQSIIQEQNPIGKDEAMEVETLMNGGANVDVDLNAQIEREMEELKKRM